MKLRLDFSLVVSTLIITLFGLLIHFSLSTSSFNLHLVFISVGILFGIAVSQLDSKVIQHFAWHIYFFAIFLLLLTLVTGASTRGSTRWIDIGNFSLQPSEFAKPMVIVAFAYFLTKFDITKLKNLTKLSLLAVIPTFLVFLQPDLGSAGIFIITIIGMFFSAGTRFRHILIVMVIALLCMPVFWHSLQTYQQTRVVTFLNPELDPLGKGYNSIQSIIAIGSGKIFGRGLGHGTQSKLRFLPEYKTDFVFASLAEELGLIGSVVLIFSFTWLIWRIFTLAKNSSQSFNYHVSVGIAIMLFSQVFINIGMNLGLLPITGITLPLISSGGSSIITSLISIGLVSSVSNTRKKLPMIEIT
ncbi:rod shape-determining protein RodA [Pseudomonadota bacterium]